MDAAVKNNAAIVSKIVFENFSLLNYFNIFLIVSLNQYDFILAIYS